MHGRQAAHALRNSLAGPLAGADDIAFAVAEVSRRCPNTGEISRQWLSWPGLLRAAEKDPALGERLDRVISPRPPAERLDFSRPLVMGIVNVTPDSFSDGGLHDDAQGAIAHGRRLAAEGADILDIGGESTRPGAAPVTVEEEIRRTIPVVRALAAEGFIVSIDTRKAAVMEAAAQAGAAIINDVSALSFDPGAPAAAAASGLPVVLMHALDTPERMQDDPRYEDAPRDIFDAMEERLEAAVSAGVRRGNIIIDPGIGFGKTLEHNLELMEQLALFHGLGQPLLLGASRKRFIGGITGVERPDQRLAGSLAAAQGAVMAGAHIVRVHDVAETVRMIKMTKAMKFAAW